MDPTATANVNDERIVSAIARHRDSFKAAVERSAMWRLLWVRFKIDRVLGGRDAFATA